MKKSRIFAAVSDQGTIYNISKRDFLCPLDCLYLQRYKAVSNLMIPASYVKSRFLGRKSGGEAAFPILINLIFHVSMTKEMKDYDTVNNSTRTVTPDCESVHRNEKQFDFSKFNEFFSDVIHPDEIIEELQEIQRYYIEASIYALMDCAGLKPLSIFPPENPQNQIYILERLINLIRSINKNL
jgi:hypothetical protein